MNTYSLHKISNKEDLSFSKSDYSRFKFGDATIGHKYGKDLAFGFISDYKLELLNSKNLVVISSPYDYIPTATFCMKDAFKQELNKWLLINKLPFAIESKMHRNTTYTQDYGELSADDRMKLISNDTFAIDLDSLKDKTLIFLDDIKITGSHEHVILNTIKNFKGNTFLLYFAELINKNIDPTIENELNYAFVSDITKLNDIIFNSVFKINTRFVKYILSYNSIDFEKFISDKPLLFKNNICANAIGNKYDKIELYQTNLKILINNINQTNQIYNYGN
jgi:hypothetical protein